jgi:hypothetical protein
MKRIHHFGPVERDDQEPPFSLDLAVFVIRHRLPLYLSAASFPSEPGRGKAWVTI